MSYSPERKSEDWLEDSKNEPSNEPVSYDVPPGTEPEEALDTYWHQVMECLDANSYEFNHRGIMIARLYIYSTRVVKKNYLGTKNIPRHHR